MLQLRPHPLFVIALLVGGCGSPQTQEGAVEFEPVPVGASAAQALIPGAGGVRTVLDGDPALSASLAADGASVEVRFEPSRPGEVSAALTLLDRDDHPVSVWSVRARGRAPELNLSPIPIQLARADPGGPAQASLWAWPETDVALEVVDPAWPPCPASGACVQTVAARAVRDLPAALLLEVGAGTAVPETITVRGCADPACAVSVPVRSAPEPGPLRCSPAILELPAVPVGGMGERRLDCEGADWVATVSHPELTVVMNSSTSATLQWRPRAAGTLVTSLNLGPAHAPIPVRGYALRAADCALVVSPNPLDFGQVPVPHVGNRTLTVTNSGPTECLIAGVQTWPSPTFTAASPAPQWLAPGQDLAVPVSFSPHRRGAHAGGVQVFAPVADLADAQAELRGEGVQAQLTVPERIVDFGPAPLCGTHSQIIRITNQGQAPGELRGIEVENSTGPEVRFSVGLPVSIPAEGAFDLLVFVEASQPGPFSRQVQLELFDGLVSSVVAVQLTGDVDELPIVEDEFVQLGLPMVDVFVLVDDGPGLSAEADYVRSSLGDFVALPHLAGIDAHFAVITTSQLQAGQREATVFASTDAEARRVSMQDALTTMGAYTSTRSDGLNIALQLLTSSVSPAMRDFIREEALLSAIVFTNRDDTSPGDVSDYVSGLRVIKGIRRTDLFTFSVLGGPPPDGCIDGNLHAEPALRYTTVANQTGGLVLSICDRSWPASSFQGPFLWFGFKSRFFLTQPAVPASIEVYVEGEPIPERMANGQLNWAYDVATQSVNFTPFAVPAPSTHIRVRYQVGCP